MEKLVTIKDLERNVTRVSTFLDVLYRDEENNQELIELAKSRLQTNLDTIQIEQAVRQSLVTEFANQIKMDTCTFAGDIVICDARTVFDTTSSLSHWEDEAQSGNREFEAAYAQQMAALHAMHSPEAEYFIEHMLPCYEQNLDELTRGRF